jgi:hypothetical protein
VKFRVIANFVGWIKVLGVFCPGKDDRPNSLKIGWFVRVKNVGGFDDA